ncbi:MAG: MFS transporter [Anaerohalosphaera sp.]|nr:MFS transporter [Anaerohalosphaera sp.]
MNQHKNSLSLQWAQLLTLTAVHMLVDIYAGMLPVILPAIRQRFNLTLQSGLDLGFMLLMTCNVVQIATGHLRGSKKSPFFMHIGLILAASMCLISLVAPGQYAMTYITIIIIISAIGIAVTHPEGLRGIHNIKLIQPAMTTAVFMAGGFVGFAGGGFLASFLVKWFGLEGLYFFSILSAIGIALIIFFRIRLAIEPGTNDEKPVDTDVAPVPFWPLMLMAIPATSATTVFYFLIPTRLEQLGFPLTYGGKSTLVLGIGSAIGYILWASIAHKKGPLATSVILHLVGVPLMYFYLAMIEKPSAPIILFFIGITASAAYPLIVTLARNAIGPGLGQRMALIVGGAWGLAAIPLKLLAPVAENPDYGVKFVLALSPIGYVLAAIVGIILILINRSKAHD